MLIDWDNERIKNWLELTDGLWNNLEIECCHHFHFPEQQNLLGTKY